MDRNGNSPPIAHLRFVNAVFGNQKCKKEKWQCSQNLDLNLTNESQFIPQNVWKWKKLDQRDAHHLIPPMRTLLPMRHRSGSNQCTAYSAILLQLISCLRVLFKFKISLICKCHLNSPNLVSTLIWIRPVWQTLMRLAVETETKHKIPSQENSERDKKIEKFLGIRVFDDKDYLTDLKLHRTK